MTRAIAALVFLVACGGSNGTTPPGGSIDAPEGHVYNDAPPVVPQMIKIAGIASENTQSGSNPLAGVTVGVYLRSAEGTALATATSDATGAYSMMVTTSGSVVDGFLKASKSGYVDNYVYPAGPFQSDQLMADTNLISSSNYSFLGLLGGQTAGKGLVVVEILDSNSMPVVGATVSSTPAAGSYKYSDSGGTPTSTTGTNTDGASFMFNVPAGDITVTASKASMTFKTHPISAHADQFTTTVVVQQ